MTETLFPALVRAEARVALRFANAPRDTLTYAQLRAAAAHLAADLLSAGVRPGERVGVWTDPSLATPVALLGALYAGAAAVPLNPKLGPRELDHIAADAGLRVAVGARGSRHPGLAPVEPILRFDDDPGLQARPVDDEPLLVLYTSGTTGPPKGAVLSARNVAANLDGLARAWRWTERDTVVHALPLFHVHGLVLGWFGSLRAGGALHWLGRFEPAQVARALAGAGDTLLFAVPTMYHRLIDAAEREPAVARGLGQARLLVSGSAGLPVREHRRLEKLVGRAAHERYGLTETLINCAVPQEDAPRPGYVGPPVPGVDLRLVDDARRPLSPSEQRDDTTIGEVAVRGDSVFRGYLGRPDASAAARDSEGWFYTGDLATRTADGYVRIVGRRATDLIKTGGYKVGAGEVEACLLEVDGVAEVAVVGAADADLGERILAFVVPRPGASLDPDALSHHVASQLTPHKRPREVHFRDALPRNAMGKVQKKRLLPES